MVHITLREITAHDSNWLARFASERWGAPTIISHGVSYALSNLPGFIAEDQGKCVGVITYHREGQTCEIVSIDSLQPDQGIGTVLLNAVKNVAQRVGCTRLWLITTNDNLTALQFYQKRNFVLVAIHRNAVELARKRKPQIPLLGENGIPLRDEIELEMLLEPGSV
jgi:N-acetylglutamate synthase-like GNAT family acetyltransferase